MNCGARIERTTPDGRRETFPRITAQPEGAAVLMMDDNTISCALEKGETTFVISLPKTSLLNRFTFVNENASAKGEMRIAVSNYHLAADSSRWTEVDGAVAFDHKRLFTLSMLGVEAKYVKLTFRVEQPGHIAGLGLYGDQSLEAFADRQSKAITIWGRLPTGRLEDALNFNFANLYARSRVMFVSSGKLEEADRMIDDDPTTGFTFRPMTNIRR